MKTRILAFTTAALGLLLAACGDQPAQVTINQAPAAAVSQYDGKLDLVAVGDLIKTNQARTGPELEQRINNTSINNLDLNGDSVADYLSVREWGNQYARGFKILDDLGNNDVREVANITIKGQNDMANVHIAGESGIYGANHAHSYDHRLADLALLSWMMSSHPVYVSPYRFGSYPTYYTRPQVVRRVVRTEIVNPQQNTPRQSAQPSNAGQSQRQFNQTQSAPRQQYAPPPAAPRQVNETRPQSSGFQVRDSSKPVASGGFGQRATTTAPAQSRPTVSAPPPSRPAPPPAPRSFSGGGGFGGSQSSNSNTRRK